MESTGIKEGKKSQGKKYNIFNITLYNIYFFIKNLFSEMITILYVLYGSIFLLIVPAFIFTLVEGTFINTRA